MDLVVKRSKWLRGEEDSYLVRGKDKKMCCLGFLGRQCKILQKDMLDIGLPSSSRASNEFPATIVDTELGTTTPLGNDMIDVNDNQRISEYQRERKLTQLFKQADIAITFVD